MKTKYVDFLIYRLLESTQDDKYAIELNENRFNEILNDKCTVFKETHQVFYRGDHNLDKDYYLINSNKTVTRMMFDFNYLTTEFVSSDLWKEKGLPLKRNSLNLSCDPGTANVFGEPFIVIPFDYAQLVKVKFLFGNYITDRLKEEGFIVQPSNIATELKEVYLKNKEITIENAKDYIDELNNLFKDIKDKELVDYHKVGITIKNGMKKHNMSFIEYMEFLFAPENYDIELYDKKFKTNTAYSYWTNSPVLLIKQSLYNNLLEENRRKETKESSGELKIIDKYVIYGGRQYKMGKFIMKNLPDDINIQDIKMSDGIIYKGDKYSFKDFINKFINRK